MSAGRRTRIVCTLGPATSTAGAVRDLVDAGMDVARLNLSHGSHDDHAALVEHVRRAAEGAGRPVAVLADLQGPKIRLGTLVGGSARLESGAELALDRDPRPGGPERVSTSHPDLARDVAVGDRLLLADGAVALRVEEVREGRVRTRVVEGGAVSDRAGVNLPDSPVSLPAVTEKDARDLAFAVRAGVDAVALSFVRSAADGAEVRERLRELGAPLPVVAKIEKPQAVDALEDVAAAFDGLMVARGDLGVEMPLEAIPAVQRRAVALARRNARPAIVATQMLDSMIESPRPTRAEVADVATAVRDGTDAVMLSGETSVGAHPVRAVRVMARILVAAELASDGTAPAPRPVDADALRADAIAEAAVSLARRLDAAALCAFTLSGATARRLASHRPDRPLVALTPEAAVQRQLALSWGVDARLVPPVDHTDRMLEAAAASLLASEGFARGDLVVLVAGSPVGATGRTNLIRVHALGE